jgi:hypothetical protein
MRLGSRDNIGMLLVRAWLHDRSLVARVVRTPDVAGVPTTTVVVTTRHQLYEEVARWLNELGVSVNEDPESEDV